MRLVALNVCLVLLVAASAPPYERCDVPVSDWQPREALRHLLEAAGWQVHSITTKDGCYEVIGRDDGGKELKSYFDPRTLLVLGSLQ